jgi:hypothetical protein
MLIHWGFPLVWRQTGPACLTVDVLVIYDDMTTELESQVKMKMKIKLAHAYIQEVFISIVVIL